MLGDQEEEVVLTEDCGGDAVRVVDGEVGIKAVVYEALGTYLDE